MPKVSQNKTRNNKGFVIICVAVVVIVIVLICVIWFQKMRENNYKEDNPNKRPTVVTEDNMDEILERDEPSEDIPPNYQVTMNSTWEFENGETASENAYVENSVNNKTAVYFDVVRNDNQETIYQSPVIPVGEHLDNIVLDEDLEAGNYECTMTYHLVDDEQNTLTTVNMWLMISVAN